MTDPLTNFVTESIEYLQTTHFGSVIALGIALWLVYALYRRTRDSSDPAVRKWGSNALGSSSILLTGVYVTTLAVVGIAVLTWPLVRDTPLVGVALVGAVAYHGALEYREAQS